MATNSTASAPRRILLYLALVLLPVVAFFPGLTSPRTHYDDPLYMDRPELAMPGSSGLWLLLTGHSAWNGNFLEYFPLRDAIYWLIFQQWEKTTLPYHLTSVFFHIVATVLVFRLIQKLGQTFWVSSAAALLFAVHPIHIESVVWIAGLKDPLYTCFALGSLFMYCDYRKGENPRHYALSLALLVCALLVKSMALSVPLIMLAMERLIAPSTRWKTIVARLAGPSVICGLFLVQFLLIGRINHIQSRPHQDSWVAHVVLSLWAQVSYLRQAFFPATFRLIYCFAPVESLADPRFLAGIAMLVATGVVVFIWRRKPVRLFCVAFYFACLLPVSNLVPFPAVMADRYLYAASIGSCLLIALLLNDASHRLKNVVMVLAVSTLTVTTALRSAIWQDEEALWQDADEDPVCIADPEFPAVDVHFLRYLTAKDDPTRLLALKRLLGCGIKKDSFGLKCMTLLSGAQLLETSGDHAQAEQWAQLAVKDCKTHPKMWGTVLMVTVHRNRSVAVTAAERWHRVDPNPVTNLFRVLTQLELKDEVEKRQELQQLVRAAPEATCPTLKQWAIELHPRYREAIAEALARCEPAGESR